LGVVVKQIEAAEQQRDGAGFAGRKWANACRVGVGGTARSRSRARNLKNWSTSLMVFPPEMPFFCAVPASCRSKGYEAAPERSKGFPFERSQENRRNRCK
jgi:hypothetical protein